VIDVRDLSMTYPAPRRLRDLATRRAHRKGSTALAGVSLSVARGECLGVLGANGAGKTTLLRLLGGLLYPTRGTVLLDGCDTASRNAEARRLVGYVLNEERSFFWRLTGRQNLRFFGVLDDVTGGELDRRVDELLERVGLQGHAGVRVAHYTSGLRQRLAIARGLLTDPRVLILDEPTRSLDPSGARQVRELIAGTILGRGDRAVVLATHDFAEAGALCDTVCVLARGRLLAHTPLSRAAAGAGGLEGYYHEVLRGEAR
jgi:ABC-2 type transport system ATP-binding protein